MNATLALTIKISGSIKLDVESQSLII